jgi:hypothetical protein
MVTFREYLLEYAKSQHSIDSGIVSMKATAANGNPNGKNFNRINSRLANGGKSNTIAQPFQHKNALVHSVIQGKANNIKLNSVQLNQILKDYNTTFDGTPKTLGNSDAEIVPLPNNAGVILRKKVQQNGL